MEHIKQWGPVVLVVVVAGAASWSVARNLAEIQAFIERIGVWGPLAAIMMQAALGASPLPAEPFTVINGVVFGPVQGSFYSWVGYMLASFVEYFIGRRVRHAVNLEKLPFGLHRFSADSIIFLIVARLVPGYGPKIVGLVAGMYRVSLWRYTWTSALPNLVGAAIFAVGGGGLALPGH